jgi:hypothetical protein
MYTLAFAGGVDALLGQRKGTGCWGRCEYLCRAYPKIWDDLGLKSVEEGAGYLSIASGIKDVAAIGTTASVCGGIVSRTIFVVGAAVVVAAAIGSLAYWLFSN